MFFKMLKNDLKMKKGLNMILFVFIALASVLMFVSASQLYMHLTGPARTNEACRNSDVILLFNNSAENREQKLSTVKKRITEKGIFTEYYFSEMLTLKPTQIDFADFEENDQENFFERKQYVTTLPRDTNLVYDLNDRPFYVENGTIRLPHDLRNVVPAKIGDSVHIITPMGRVYELTIAGYFKEPLKYNYFRYLVSDEDYQIISQDFPVKTDAVSLFTNVGFGIEADEKITEFIVNLPQKDNITLGAAYRNDLNMTEDYLISYIITFAIILISIFMLIIILMTIRFTMVSAMRDEEKEIGMMRAMGIDSLQFRWLFAAKYIAFAVTGGVFGILAGLPISRKVMQMFSGGIILPPTGELIIVGTISALVMAGAIILFSLIVMRRIRHISVIDAIHGENHGERFGKASALLLHNRRRMPVPIFLGLSDILTRMKRYLFLVIAYTLGGMLILLTSHLYHSVINLDFMKYYMVYSMDFYPDFSDDMMKEYERREIAENKDFWEIYNEDLEKNGIAAHVDLCRHSVAELQTGGAISTIVYFNFDDDSAIRYSEGKAPVLPNEAALSSYTARNRGIKVGDEIDIIIDEYSEDMLSAVETEKKLIVTGLVDVIETGYPSIIMGREYDKGCIRGTTYTAVRITGEDKQAEFDKICKLFNGHTLTPQESLERDLIDYKLPLELLRDVVAGTVVFVNILLTMLYMNIFVAEDKSEIALQRCLGFTDGKIRAAQLFRMMTLVVFSILAAILFAKLIGEKLFDVLFGVLGLSGFRFLPQYLLTWVIMPAVSILTVLIPSLIKLRGIGSIDIASISEE